MTELIKLLRDTPVPSLLVIGGLAFMILPVLRKVGANIEIKLGWEPFSIFVGIILLVLGIGLYAAPAFIPPVASATPIFPATEESAAPESENWAFTLEYRFPDGFWSAGTHSYSFAFTCPNEPPDGVERDFNVSESYPLISGDVYLRWAALKEGNPWGGNVDGINPVQSTVAAIAWDGITESEANWRASACTGVISWDKGTTRPMTTNVFRH